MSTPRPLHRVTRAWRHRQGLLRANLEGQVEARTRQLGEANRELQDFAFSVSHDLRAPLRHMEGFADLLSRHLEGKPGALDDKGRHYLERIAGASRAMGSLIDDLLTYSRLASQEMHTTTVDLDRMFSSLRERLPADLSLEIGRLGKVKGDSSQLRQAFLELLTNAKKFSSSKEEIDSSSTIESSDFRPNRRASIPSSHSFSVSKKNCFAVRRCKEEIQIFTH